MRQVSVVDESGWRRNSNAAGDDVGTFGRGQADATVSTRPAGYSMTARALSRSSVAITSRTPPNVV